MLGFKWELPFYLGAPKKIRLNFNRIPKGGIHESVYNAVLRDSVMTILKKTPTLRKNDPSD